MLRCLRPLGLQCQSRQLVRSAHPSSTTGALLEKFTTELGYAKEYSKKYHVGMFHSIGSRSEVLWEKVKETLGLQIAAAQLGNFGS